MQLQYQLENDNCDEIIVALIVQLHLDIDENQNEEEAFWFPFLPPSVNIMCSMPLIGESVRLYFPNESSENPISREPKSVIWCESLKQTSKSMI